MTGTRRRTHATIEAPEGTNVVWAPAPGFQTRALAAGEDELLIGGAKGSGKSDILIARATRQVDKPLYKALITRNSYTEMVDLIARQHRIYPKIGKAHWRGDDRAWIWPSGAMIKNGYLETLKNCTVYQGGEWAEWDHDEMGNQPDERVLDTMLAELRCPDPTVHRSACFSANPGGPGHAMLKRRFIVPTLEGQRTYWQRFEIRGQVVWNSRRFIAGTVWDNPTYARDPKYLARLMGLPERLRKYLLDGSWDDPMGMAFDMLSRSRHFVKPFGVPKHWTWIGGYDWGIAHPAVFIYAAVDEDGQIWVVDTIWLLGMSDEQMARRIAERAPLDKLRGIPAGHDVFAEKRQYEHMPTTAERFQEERIILTHAILDRRQGYLNVVAHLEWRPDPDFGIVESDPHVRFMDTPGNRRLYAQLETLVMDPDDPGKVLKDSDYRVDSLPTDVDDPIPGDDGFDAFRYMLAERPMPARAQVVIKSPYYMQIQRRIQYAEPEPEHQPDTDSLAYE